MFLEFRLQPQCVLTEFHVCAPAHDGLDCTFGVDVQGQVKEGVT
jgi:hypothetical protein